ALQQRPAEVECAQLRDREPGFVETTEGALLQRPVLLAVVHFVEERKAGRLQRLEIAPDGSRGDAGPSGEVVDRDPSRRLEIAEDRPLADDFSVPRHDWKDTRPRVSG